MAWGVVQGYRGLPVSRDPLASESAGCPGGGGHAENGAGHVAGAKPDAGACPPDAGHRRLLRKAAAAGLFVSLAALALLSVLRPWRRTAAAQADKRDSEISFVGVTPTNVRWLAHPDKCLDVAGTKEGAALQIWDCDPSYPYQQGFLVPPDGTTGRIKWAENPELCLDSPGGHALQFWRCDDAPAENLLWTVSPDGTGRIHWAAHPDQCVDIPDAITDNGWKLQVWWCENATRQGKDSNLRFMTHPVNCEWGEWSDWGPCSKTCGGGLHERGRKVVVHSMNAGKECVGDPEQSERCNLDSCNGKAGITDGTTTWPSSAGGGSTTPMFLFPPDKHIKPLDTRNSARHRTGPFWAAVPLSALLAAIAVA